MTLQEPIHDIVVAPAAHWWPLAPGWYALGLLSIAVLVTLLLMVLRRYYRMRARRLALCQLQQQTPSRITDITLLLKQAALAYHSHAVMVAWWDFLADQLPAKLRQHYQPLLNTLAEVSYQPPQQQQAWLEPYHAFAQVWLRQALPPQQHQNRELHHD